MVYDTICHCHSNLFKEVGLILKIKPLKDNIWKTLYKVLIDDSCKSSISPLEENIYLDLEGSDG